MKIKKPSYRLIILLSLITVAVLATIYSINQMYPTLMKPRNPPELMPEPDNIYTFSPNTILSDLDQGKVDTFIILPNKEGDLPSKYLGDINWDELDYWKVAGALHTFVWNEPIEQWNIYFVSYRIHECQNEFHGFDQAYYFVYKQQNNLYLIHKVLIDPYAKVIDVFDTSTKYEKEWPIIASENIIVGASEALSIAEEHGGKEARSQVENKCSVFIEFGPDRFLQKFLFCPFCYRHWGWQIEYWPSEFEITIDPFTGKYE